MTDSSSNRRPARSALWKRLLLAAISAGVALVLVETTLWWLKLPRIYTARSTPGQFHFLPDLDDGVVGYVNAPSHRIRFTYHDNPRNYFGSLNEVDHYTNTLGFRGVEWPVRQHGPQLVLDKNPNQQRVLFLGDSFTFGEGVRREHLFAELVPARLRDRLGLRQPQALVGMNLGVGGYNTHQERVLLERLGVGLNADAVVLTYVLNDAEPAIFERDPATGQPSRVQRAIQEMVGDSAPPRDGIYWLRSMRLYWQYQKGREQTARTYRYYRELYQSESDGWREAQAELTKIRQVCEEEEIPLLLVLFPLLYQLDDSYPFQEIHQQIAAVCEQEKIPMVDLFPAFKGQVASAMWVHPTDHHPNELAHAIAAEQISKKLSQLEWFGEKK